MRADGSSVQRLTSDAYGHAGPAWSPDGKTIAYQAFGYIDRINIDGTHWKRLFAQAGEDFGACCPAWSPNGQEIAYVNGHGNVATIWVMRSDGSNKRRIASPTADGVGYTYPTWSPNGTWIAFSYLLPARNGSARGYLGLIRATGRGRIKRLKLGYAPWQPAWSRDGSKIAVSDTLDRIEVLNLRTGRISRLLTGQHPSWSRGGTSIVYDCGSGSPTRTYRGPGEICTMRVDGSHMRRLTH
ncbi:MAG TPA: hypothetical protein VF002_05470 [Gaiellaceae bacterium]